MNKNAFVHIYAQNDEHSPAHILGTRDGLRDLGNALIKAADQDETHAVALFATDGEGYTCFVLPKEIGLEFADEGPHTQLPYGDNSINRDYPNAKGPEQLAEPGLLAKLDRAVWHKEEEVTPRSIDKTQRIGNSEAYA